MVQPGHRAFWLSVFDPPLTGFVAEFPHQDLLDKRNTETTARGTPEEPATASDDEIAP